MKIDPAIWWGVGLGGAALVALAVAQGKINLGGKTSNVGSGETGGVEVDKPDPVKPPPTPDPYPYKPLPIGRPVILDTKTNGTTVLTDPAVGSPTPSNTSSTAKPTERETARRWRKTYADAAAGNYTNALKVWEVGTRGSRGPQAPNANTKFSTGATLCGLFRDGMDLAYPDVEQCKRTGGVDCDSLRDAASDQVRAAIEGANQFIDANGLRNDPDFLKGLQSCSSTNLCAEYQPTPMWQGVPADVEAARKAEHDRLRAALGCPPGASAQNSKATREFRTTNPGNKLPIDLAVGRPVFREL